MNNSMNIYSVYYKLIRSIISNGGAIGALASDVHTSILKYVSGYSNGVSIIDRTITIKSIIALVNVVRIRVKRNRTIIIVANSEEHQRLAKSILESLPKNVILLTTRWNPGIFSNYDRFREMIAVFNRKADINKTSTMVRNHYNTYGDVQDMYLQHKVPQLVIFMNRLNHEDALTETRNHGIPVAAVVNTDYDDSKGELHYKIPIGNNIIISTLFRLILREALQYTHIPNRHKKKRFNNKNKLAAYISYNQKIGVNYGKRSNRYMQGPRISKRMQLAKNKWLRRKPFLAKARKLHLYLTYKARKGFKVDKV